MLGWASWFDVAREGLPRTLQNRRKCRIRLAVGIVVGDAESAACVQGEVVRLTWMGDSRVVGQQGTARRETVDVRRLRIADDLAIVVVLHHH